MSAPEREVDSEREAMPPERAASAPVGAAAGEPGAAPAAADVFAEAEAGDEPGPVDAAARSDAPRPGGAVDSGESPLPGDTADRGDVPEPGDAVDAEPAGDGVAEPLGEAELRARADQADVYLDLAQRTRADFDNYRKRMTREVRAAESRGIGRLARELLPALDNLERALEAVEASDPDHHLSAGIRLVTAELSAALGRTGIQGYKPTGEPFDPSQHEAVAQQPVEGAEPGTVVQVLQSGYRLNESILRPARVIVAS